MCRKSKSKLKYIYVAGIIISIILFVFPLVADLFTQFLSNSNISKMTSLLSEVNTAEKDLYLNQAVAYNKNLSGLVRTNVWPYTDQLNIKKDSMMSYLEIKKINIKLPIFHGTEQKVLMAGVGHLQESSLPVGGNDSHCVLSAHSGMSSMRAFDDLRKLENGDKFVLWTLSEPYCYEVFSIEVVEPYQTDSLKIFKNQDLCTLITCTPYAINTHRLLVHGKRCPFDESESVSYADSYLNSRFLLFLLCILVAVILFLFFILRKKINSRISLFKL